MKYRVFSDFRQGLPHKGDHELPCQDYAAVKSDSDSNIYIAALSDGHGSWKHFRSDRGSKFAVEIMINMLERFAKTNAERPDQSAIDGLCASVVDTWLDRIALDYADNPVSDDELVRFPSEEAKKDIDKISAYGATLQGALMTENYLLLLQLGDGRMVVLHENGKVDQPVPWDKSCVGNITTSLCNDDSKFLFRSLVIETAVEHIAAVFLTSDGLEDIQPSLAALNAFFSNVALEYSSDPEYYDSSYLLESNNQKDDVSVAAIIDSEAVMKNESKYRDLQLLDYTDYEELAYYLQGRIKSKKAGIESAKNRIDMLEKRLGTFATEPAKVVSEAKGFLTNIAMGVRKLKAKIESNGESDKYEEINSVEENLNRLGAPKDLELDVLAEIEDFRGRLRERQEALAELERELQAVGEKEKRQELMLQKLENGLISDEEGEIEF